MWEKHNQLKKQAQAGVEICLIFKICREKGDFMEMKFTTIFVAFFVLFCCVFATGCSRDNNDPKSKAYPYIPNEILRNKEMKSSTKNILLTMMGLPPEWDFSIAGISFQLFYLLRNV